MRCKFKHMIYPKPGQYSANGFMVAVYTPLDAVPDGKGGRLSSVKVVGYMLPHSKQLAYDITGRWEKNEKYGDMQLQMESFTEIVAPNREDIVAYLSCGAIKGIGKSIAGRVYEAFGDRTLEILDREPDRLLAVRGIGENTLRGIRDSYIRHRGARDVIAALAPHGVTVALATKIFEKYGADTMTVICEHPYRLCEMAGVGFRTADAIAVRMGLDLASQERVMAGTLHALTEAETLGHLCLEPEKLMDAAADLLATPELGSGDISRAIRQLQKNGKIEIYLNRVYRRMTADAERAVARHIRRIADVGVIHDLGLDREIDLAAARFSVTLDALQRQAVKMVLTNRASIITGGPGTGKTMIQRIVLEVFSRVHNELSSMCCAPTGRAARRLEQTTGHPASTIHKALGLYAGDDDYEPGELETDLLLVDESSMLDIFLAAKLFAAVRTGAILVLVGDSDQLPSVGPGAVLSELIASEAIPVTKLDKVYRQQEGGSIAENAAGIRHGITSLEYAQDFRFVDAEPRDAPEILEREYLLAVSRYGLDNTVLLSPFRTKTESGVNALNVRLRDKINPASSDKRELVYGKRLFREGDKIMQMKNRDIVNNGDTGYVRSIAEDGDGNIRLTADFEDGRVMEYSRDELSELDHAYAMSVHKSQGSEYDAVILSMQAMYFIMLKRPLIYTAVTRAKKSVVIVGEKKAINRAIRTPDTERRGTMLAARILGVRPGTKVEKMEATS